MKAQVRERDAHKCVLTGEDDYIPGTTQRIGFEVAHIIPYSLVNNGHIHSYIKDLVPWMPHDFFDHIDTCENMILLNQVAHRLLGKFSWFITMDEDGTTYRASQVEDNGLLQRRDTRREVELPNGDVRVSSSFNQPLFIGVGSHPCPSKVYVRLHELLARIIFMRGGSEYFKDDTDDDDESLVQESMGYEEKVRMFLTHQSLSDSTLFGN
jgi:hypothetical protein